jgi:hypothetical protein
MDILKALLPVVVAGLMTAFLGNYLVQQWQMRNWRAQQRQLGYQAELDEFKKLIEEISIKASDRHNAMRRLVSSLSPNSKISFDESLADYKQQLVIWNGSLSSFFVRLKYCISNKYSIRMEKEVHDYFRLAGEKIENVIRSRNSGISPSWNDLERSKSSLNLWQKKFIKFSSDISREYENKKSEIFEGVKLYYIEDNLEKYSFFELVKSIFVLPIEGQYVVRAP